MRGIQKSITLLVIMTIALVPPLVRNGQASPTTGVEIDPETTVVYKGQKFTVDIHIFDTVDISALQFALRYNPSILDALDVTLPQAGDFMMDIDLLGVPTVWQGYDCDVIQDGVLDIYDMVAFVPGTANPRADINGDGVVGLDDLRIFLRAWYATAVIAPGTIFFYRSPFLGALESGVFANVTFRAIELTDLHPFETPLELDDAKLSSIIPEPIPHEVYHGSVQVYPIQAWASTTPRIDGIISSERAPNEWRDAAKVDIYVRDDGGEERVATLYAKNDYVNLYLALEVPWDLDLSRFGVIRFLFDNDNDGVKESGDNVLALEAKPLESRRLVDEHIDLSDPYLFRHDVRARDGGISDGVGASRRNLHTGAYDFEIAFPLNTFDDMHDFSLSVGDSVGFNVDFSWAGFYRVWPSGSPSEIHLASPEPTGTAQLKVTDSTPEEPVPFTIDGQSSWDGSPVQTGEYYYTLTAGVPHEIELPDPYTAPQSGITYYFSHWEDGSTDNPRTVILEPDSTVHIHGTYSTVPPDQPPSPAVDLRISGIEVTQAIQHRISDAIQVNGDPLPLVKSKITAVRAYIDIGPVIGPIDVSVYLYGLDGQYGPFLGELRTSFSAPTNPDRGESAHSANFLLPRNWVNCDSLILKAFVKASSASQHEADYDNNWMMVWQDGHTTPEPLFRFYMTRHLDIHLVPIEVTWWTGGWPNPPADEQITQAEEFLRAIYPVSGINFLYDIPVLQWSGDGWGDLNSQLYIEAQQRGIEFPDQVFGILSWSFNMDWARGMAAVGGCDYVVSSGASTKNTMAHEIIHNLGRWSERVLGEGTWGSHTWDDTSSPYYGTSTQDLINEYGATYAFGQPLQVYEPDTLDIMYSFGSSHWISPYRWENMLSLFVSLASSSLAGQSAPNALANNFFESLLTSGWVSKNGTGSLDPIFCLPVEPSQPQMGGNCSVELQDSSNVTLLAANFEPRFVNAEGIEEDLYHFVMFLPYQPGTTRVVLKCEGEEIYSFEKSMNTPTVQIITPNGGEVWNSDVQTVAWTAEDADNDTLSYRLYYSSDNGASWRPISPTITQTSYQVDASFIQGSDVALIRVVASDGLNTGQDDSDAVFTVMDKPPTAMILQPEDESRFLMDDVILLRGRGTDADDRILPDSAFNWTSSLDGYLGDGSTLTTMLLPGTHQITLKVTDSKGNTASDTVTIKVSMDIEITGVAPSQTVVEEGFPIHLNVTVENLSPITQTVHVAAKVFNATYEAEIDPSPIAVTLPPGNSATLAFTWDTAGFATGNYTISAVAETYAATITSVSDADTVILPNTVPSLTVETPSEGDALQDGVTFRVSAWDISGVASVTFSIQCAQGNVISPEFESMPAKLSPDGKWELYFDTTELPDGFYLFIANGTDVFGNSGTTTVQFSIRNWACLELLPASERNKAGRTMPVKFSLRVVEAVDPAQPFVYNEELTIGIFEESHPEDILQESTLGDTSKDYRINSVDELYITNFRTFRQKLKTYIVEIYRKGMLLGSFEFSTVK